MKNVIDVLKKRGFLDAVTSEEVRDLCEKPQKIYVGFDPTADSLHLGNLVGIIALSWFQRYGHTPVALVGGATGMIGDPSGKSTERNLLDSNAIENNIRGIQKSLSAILDFNKGAKLLNNYEWFKDFHFLEFLRSIGKYFRVGAMLAKDSVKSRMASEEGMSYTEFSYQLLQAYDFLYLNDHYDVSLQMGGSDQWGNITAGTELIRRMRSKAAFGLTFPLITRSDGKKFGKSEEGAIWLNSDKLPPYDFYQYLYRMPDADIPKLMRMLTFMDVEEIETIADSMKKSDYVPNSAQKRLAEEVTRLVHGEKGLQDALRITQAAAPGAKTVLNGEILQALASEIPSMVLPKKEIIGMKIIDLLVKTNLLASKGEAKRLLSGGGAYLNNEKVDSEQLAIENHHLVEGSFLLIAVGKKKKMVIKVL